MSDASRDGLVQMSDQELADYLDRVAAGRDWVREAARRLRAFIRDVRPGGCGIYSQGAACQCPLCDVDRLALAWHGERPATTGIIEQLEGLGDWLSNRAIDAKLERQHSIADTLTDHQIVVLGAIQALTSPAPPAAPRGQTCATCQHWHKSRHDEGFGGCGRGVRQGITSFTMATFGCTLHEPAAPAPASPEEK